MYQNVEINEADELAESVDSILAAKTEAKNADAEEKLKSLAETIATKYSLDNAKGPLENN